MKREMAKMASPVQELFPRRSLLVEVQDIILLGLIPSNRNTNASTTTTPSTHWEFAKLFITVTYQGYNHSIYSDDFDIQTEKYAPFFSTRSELDDLGKKIDKQKKRFDTHSAYPWNYFSKHKRITLQKASYKKLAFCVKKERNSVRITFLLAQEEGFEPPWLLA